MHIYTGGIERVKEELISEFQTPNFAMAQQFPFMACAIMTEVLQL